MDTQETGPIEAFDDVADAAEALRNRFNSEQSSETEEVQEEVSQEDAAVETEADDTPEEPQEQKQFITVKIDGKEELIPLDEAAAGYQRQRDYTRKTTEIAELRKAAEAERIAAQQERAYYANQLSNYMSSLSELVQQDEKVDWAKLLETNPIEYLKKKEAADNRKIHLQNLDVQRQAIAEQEQLETRRHIETVLRDEAEKLLNALPEWKDEKKAKEEKAAVAEYLKGYGYGDDEVNAVTDHRAVLLARKAMLYDKLQQSKASLNQRVEKLPPKVERPGGSNESAPRDKAAFQRLLRTGSIDDAAAVLAARIRK